MKLMTNRFGQLDVDESKLITFEKGILGFPQDKRFIFIDANETSPLKWLQSADSGDLAFVVIDPVIFKPDYQPKVFKNDLADLEVIDPDTLICLVIVTVPEDPRKMTANLKGPLLINTGNNKAKQIVLDDAAYQLRYRLISDEDIAEAV